MDLCCSTILSPLNMYVLLTDFQVDRLKLAKCNEVVKSAILVHNNIPLYQDMLSFFIIRIGVTCGTS
jgi:hypothetical protein